MGWDTTRVLRFYPKDGVLGSINIERIVEEINATAKSLSNEIVYSKNTFENCYDLKFNSSKLSGEFSFSQETTEVWDLISFEEGETRIGNISEMTEFKNTYYKTALFTFDEIVINGVPEKLTSFFEKYFPLYSAPALKEVIDNRGTQVVMSTNGIYTSNNQHDTGGSVKKRKGKKPIRAISQDEFYEQCEVNGLMEEIVHSEESLIELEELITFFKNIECENPYKYLSSISFNYKNKEVKSVKWIEQENKYTNQKRKYWEFKSADSWRNCVNPLWNEFRKIKTDENIKA